MKKGILFLFALMIIIISIAFAKYSNYISKKRELQRFNDQFTQYENKDVSGVELTSIINNAIDNNEKNHISKDKDGFYIENNTNSIKIDIKMIDIDSTYKMETIYNGGMANFVQYYNSIYFECKEIKFNNQGRVNYLFFIQKNT